MYSRREAVSESYLLWRVLRDSGDYSKEPSLSLMHSEGILSLARYALNCPLCEYTRKKREQGSCGLCPIRWPLLRKYSDDPAPNPCLNSYFAVWRFGDKRIRKAAAGGIVRLFEAQYPAVASEARKQFTAGRMCRLVNESQGPGEGRKKDRHGVPLHALMLLHEEARQAPIRVELIDIGSWGAYATTRDIFPAGRVCSLEIIPRGKNSQPPVCVRGAVISQDKGGIGIRFREALDPQFLEAILRRNGGNRSTG